MELQGRQKNMKKLNLANLTALLLVASALPALAGPVQVPVSVPESGQTLLLLGAAVIAVVALRCKLAK
jgi:hypothetical protein